MKGRALSLVVLAALSACDTVAFDDRGHGNVLQIACESSSDCPAAACKCGDGTSRPSSPYCDTDSKQCTGYGNCETPCEGHGGAEQDFGSWLFDVPDTSGSAGSGTAGSGTSGSGTSGKAGSGGAGTCPSGGSVTKVVSLASPRGTLVAVSPTEIYVIDGMVVTKVNGTFLVPMAAVPSPPKWLAVSGGTLIAAAVDGIYATPTAGTGSWLKIANATGVRAIAPTTGNQVLFGWGVSGFPIFKVPLAGGAQTALTTTNQDAVLSIATSGSVMVWAAKSSNGFRLWSGSTLNIGAPVILPEVQDLVDPSTYGGQNVATDGASAFFVDAGSDVLSRVAVTGGAVQSLAPAVSSSIFHPVHLDGTKLYYAHHPGGCSGAVMSVAKTGGTPTVVATGQDAYAFATDSTNLYWLSGKDLYRAPK